MHTLSSIDEFFLTDEKGCIVLGCVKFQAFDFDKMSLYMKNNFAKGITKANCKLVSVWGKHYFQEMENPELDIAWSKSCKNMGELKTK
jgi:hypothetical protein